MKKDIYNDQTYLTNNPTWHEEDTEFKVDRIESILRKHQVSFEKVCDVGCGSGEILLQLLKRFPEIKTGVGYDISNDAIAIADKKTNDRLHFELQDIAFTDDSISFDLMLVIDVIEHLENYFSFLDSISGKSRYFVFHIPLDMSVWSLMREGILIESKKRVGHIHNFTQDFILSILVDHGFTILGQAFTEPVNKVESFKQRIVDIIRQSLYKISPRFCSKFLGGYSIMVLAQRS
ncbi:MAG: class I SAM-dependent methyltransferase [Bacteroidota bacterium]